MTSTTVSAAVLSAPSPVTEPPRSLTTTLAPGSASMSIATSVIGAKTGAWRVRVERAPVANFARVLGDTNPVLADTPAPPTFSFVMAYWGAYGEDQPPDPTGGTNPMHKIMGELHG